MNSIIYYNFYDAVTLKLNFNEYYLLCGVDFCDTPIDIKSKIFHPNHKYFIDLLDNYFNISKYDLDFNLLDTKGLTNFYMDVYKTLLKTKVGMTTTYKKLAADAGYKNAYRAVGSCMRKNRWPVFIPCHRVLSTNSIGNSIGGYSSGIWIKKRLLELEKNRL
jgi:methylated-DNA-[protein]-cysteine S-methyltransferase